MRSRKDFNWKSLWKPPSITLIISHPSFVWITFFFFPSRKIIWIIETFSTRSRLYFLSILMFFLDFFSWKKLFKKYKKPTRKYENDFHLLIKASSLLSSLFLPQDSSFLLLINKLHNSNFFPFLFSTFRVIQSLSHSV